MQIADNTLVSIDYTLTDGDGEVIDSSKGREPLTYVHGTGQLIPGLEAALEGQSAGDDVEVEVAPRDGYGERDERLVQAVPRSAFQGVDRVEKGMRFQARADSGQARLITVTAVEGDTVTIDANHPLAGKPLHFKVSVVEVREPGEGEADAAKQEPSES